MRRLLSSAALACLAFGFTAYAGSDTAQNRPRIVAVGDVHGAADSFVAILQTAGLIDANKNWVGGRSVLVQTGDVTDRGAGTKAALDLLMSLEKQAPKSGGRVHYLLGNHEVMNLTGHMRDASPEIFASFGGEAAMRQAFGPDGEYGRWLRRKPVILPLNGTIFMHAGISPAESTLSIDDLNGRAKRELEAWDGGVRQLVKMKLVPPAPEFRQAAEAARLEIERLNELAAAGKVPEDAPQIARLLLPVANIGQSSLYRPDGPLWFRGFENWTDEEGAPLVADLLKRYKERRFVTGHNPQRDGRIRERFGSSLFLIDTGMLGKPFFPSGRPSALTIEGDAPKPLYLPEADPADPSRR